MIRSRFRGCFLGGAVGDALGAPIEFMRRQDILEKYGERGLRDMVPAYGRLGAITDDTQMALFTAEGLLRSFFCDAPHDLSCAPESIARAYLRWLHTQDLSHPLQQDCLNGWLLKHQELFARRAPGRTCIAALQALRALGQPARNDSKGCGGVMRVAPIGMMLQSISVGSQQGSYEHFQKSFDLGCAAAGVTHGHSTGQLASGAFSAIIFQLLAGMDLLGATLTVLELLAGYPGHEETSEAIRLALKMADEQPNNFDALKRLGEGWVAEEALAIGLYCAYCAIDIESGVIMAVNHDGDSDSTGLIAGHLLGAMHGVAAIPSRWLKVLELRTVIEQVADDLADVGYRHAGDHESVADHDFFTERYPCV